LIEQGLPRPDIIKCDIEGAEYKALRGAERTLLTHKPLIFLATHGAEVHRECCEFLHYLGYALLALDGKPIAESQEVEASAHGIADLPA
jgi:hypothetical protein